MSKSLADLIANAKKAPRQHHDVDVYLDDDSAERIAELEREAETLKTDTRLGDPRPAKIAEQIAAIEAAAADSVAVLRFRRLPPEQWAEIIARCPQRIDVPVDRIYGYNVHDAANAAVPAAGWHVTRGDDGAEEEAPLDEDQWEELRPLLAGRDFTRIVDAIFDLNDYGPKEKLDAARKASRAGTGTTSN